MSIKVRFTIRAEPSPSDNKTTVPHLKPTIYKFPDKYKNLRHHELLMATPAAAAAKKDLTPRWTKRIFKITLPEDIAKLYVDQDGNAIFMGTMLDVYEDSLSSSSMSVSAPNPTMSANNTSTETKPRSLASITKDMVITKFGSKNRPNAEAWIAKFEKECRRVEVTQDRFWEVIRLFVEDGAEKWYETTASQTDSTSWEFWKNSFMENFGQRSLSTAKQAFTYRYVSGSLSDYVQTKQNLLANFNPYMHETDKIAHIALGLPPYLQDRINLADANTLGKLLTTINSFNNPNPRSISTLNSNNSTSQAASSNTFASLRPRNPCAYCQKKRFERFHLEKECFTKFRDNQRKSNVTNDLTPTKMNNVTKAVHNIEIDDMQKEIQENQKNE